MKTITVRNIPPEVAKLIRDRARRKRLSANRAVLDLLLERAGSQTVRPEQLHHDLDELAGAWSRREATEFEKELSAQRTMDGRLWQ
jgi:hypothetical protein